MKALAWILSAGLAFGAAPPMPEWEAEDLKALKKGDLVPGLLLLTEEDAPVAAVPEPTPEEVAESAKARPEVAEQYLEAYFAERPAGFLVDPQELLGSKGYRDREKFLEYHSGDSKIDLFVYLFDGHQEIPSEVREEEIVERHFAEGKPAVVVYYYLGEPGRSDIYVSPRISDAVSAAEQRRALESSLAEALEKPDKFAQFEAFCVQLSIRIYWMERAAGLVKEVPRLAALPAPAAQAEQESRAIAPEFQAILSEWGSLAGFLLAIAATAAAGVYFVRSRARYRFPAFDVPPRLGGAHAAGIGAVISFGSTTRPPSSQRNEVPDYLGL